MVEALKPDHAVTLLTWRAPDLAALNRFFGTTIGPGDLAVALHQQDARAPNHRARRVVSASSENERETL